MINRAYGFNFSFIAWVDRVFDYGLLARDPGMELERQTVRAASIVFEIAVRHGFSEFCIMNEGGSKLSMTWGDTEDYLKVEIHKTFATLTRRTPVEKPNATPTENPEMQEIQHGLLNQEWAHYVSSDMPLDILQQYRVWPALEKIFVDERAATAVQKGEA